MPKFLVQYIEEREEYWDWDTQSEKDDEKAAIKEAKEMLESSNIDAVRVVETKCVFEEYNHDAHDRPWSK